MPKKYIFSINSGRSGSKYLSELLSCVENGVSVHEDQPDMSGEIMFNYLKGHKDGLKKMMERKVEKITSYDEEIFYSDTNHCFIKGFGWEIPKYIPENKLIVIVLKRDKSEIVSSYYKLNTLPFNYLGRDWLITPDCDFQTKPPITPFKFKWLRFLFMRIDDFNYHFKSRLKYPGVLKKLAKPLLHWYLEELEVKTTLYKKTFPNIKYVEVHLKDINNYDGFKNLLKEIGMNGKINSKISSILNVPQNTFLDNSL